MKVILFSVLFHSVFFRLYAAQAWLNPIEFGSFAVGFQSATAYDPSRPAIHEQREKTKGRQLQVNVWYPATVSVRNAHKKLTYADYVALIGKELDLYPDDSAAQRAGLQKYFEWPASQGAQLTDFDAFLNRKEAMKAVANAKWASGTFPLVFLVHGFAADYAFLAEYLASFGYVVVNVPTKGTLAYELDYEDQGLGSQISDYEFALQWVKKHVEKVDASRLSAIGFSFGGISALGLAMRNPQVKAVISLDGGIGSAWGGSLPSQQAFYRETNSTGPLLHFYNPNDLDTDLRWLEKHVRSDRYFIGLLNVTHGHFTSFGLLDKKVPFIMGSKAPRPGNAYETMMLVGKRFLDKSLKKDSTPVKQLVKEKWIADCIRKYECQKGT